MDGCSSGDNDVINLKDHSNTLCGEGEGANLDEGWLQYIGLLHILNRAVSDINSRELLS